MNGCFVTFCFVTVTIFFCCCYCYYFFLLLLLLLFCCCCYKFWDKENSDWIIHHTNTEILCGCFCILIVNSYRRNKKARVTQFKRGNKWSVLYHAQRPELPDPHPDSEDSPVISRPYAEEYQDACQIAARDEVVNQRLVCPAKLIMTLPVI